MESSYSTLSLSWPKIACSVREGRHGGTQCSIATRFGVLCVVVADKSGMPASPDGHQRYKNENGTLKKILVIFFKKKNISMPLHFLCSEQVAAQVGVFLLPQRTVVRSHLLCMQSAGDFVHLPKSFMLKRVEITRGKKERGDVPVMHFAGQLGVLQSISLSISDHSWLSPTFSMSCYSYRLHYSKKLFQAFTRFFTTGC